MPKKIKNRAPIVAFDHAPRCGGTWLTFEYFAFIFGWERMLVWGSDFPLGECSEQATLNFASQILESDSQLRWIGGHINPEWALPREMGGSKVEWVTQIRHPAAQLQSARARFQNPQAAGSRARLAATLQRVTNGEYSVVGILGSDFDSDSLSARLTQEFAWPSIQAPARNASNYATLPSERTSLNGHSAAENEYEEFWFAGKEMLEWWQLAVQWIRQSEISGSSVDSKPEISNFESVIGSPQRPPEKNMMELSHCGESIETIHLKRPRHLGSYMLATIRAKKLGATLRTTQLLFQLSVPGANIEYARIGLLPESAVFKKVVLFGRRLRKVWFKWKKPYVRWDLVDGQRGMPYRRTHKSKELIVVSKAPRFPVNWMPLRLTLKLSNSATPQDEPPQISNVWHF